MYNNIALLLGHLTGDYLFQTDHMARNKTKKTMHGFLCCTAHCIVYSICVGVFVVAGGWRSDIFFGSAPEANFVGSLPVAMFIAFITHYHIDRHSFGSWWMKRMGMGFAEAQKEDEDPNMMEYRKYFVAPVYCAVDNTIHLILMWVLLSMLGS